MSFAAEKILLYLALPPASLIVMMAAGFLLVRVFRGFGRFLIAAAFLLLYAFSIRPVSDALVKPFEQNSAAADYAAAKADAIVALGGGVRDLSWLHRRPEVSGMSLERLIGAIRLYRMLHLPLVLSGGSGDPDNPGISEAEAWAALAAELGVPAKDLVVEGKSRNTKENAAGVRRLVKGNRIILVTSAIHMRRAAAFFRKQGFTVIPAPTGFLSEQRPLSGWAFIPHAGNLDISSAAIYEYLGILWYTVHGDI